jgi:site-specific DNA recombinase
MKAQTNLKYYIYLRKSSEGEDRQVQSIERQADEVNKLITYQGLQVVGTFEECKSAMVPENRPEFKKMIRGIKIGKANGIVCWHINRLARNPLESGIIQQLLEDGKIKSILTKDREYTSADNSIILSVESSLATQYSKDLGKMVRSGMDKKVSQGIAPFKAPIGYLNTKMAEHGSNYIMKDPERFDIVRQIWDMILSRQYTTSKILEIVLNETGLKPRPPRGAKLGKLTISGLYSLLNNPFYAGLFYYKGQLIQGKHEPMVTVTEFDAVQELLGRNGNSRHQKHKFTYTGIIKCGECGCAITATKKSKLIKSNHLYKSYTYYYCTQRKQNIKCLSRKILTVYELENQIIDEMYSASINDSFFNLAVKIIKQNSDTLKSQAEAIQQQQKKEIITIEKEVKNLLQLRISDAITDEEFQQEKNDRENRLSIINVKLEESKSHPYYLLTQIESKLKELVNLKERFISASEEGRRKMFLALGGNYLLIGKKLNIIKPLWLQTIEKNIKNVEPELIRFELEKYIDINTFNIHFKDMFPLMWALLEEVGTSIDKEIKAPQQVAFRNSLPS